MITILVFVNPLRSAGPPMGIRCLPHKLIINRAASQDYHVRTKSLRTHRIHGYPGLQDDPHRQKYIRKEYIYSKAGIKHGKKLIYTYDSESGGLNMRLVREIIKDAYRL